MMQISKRKSNKFRRKNAKLYPIYKMCSWDLLSYYSVEFLFLTITKGIEVSKVLFISAFYLMSKMLLQIPAIIVCDAIGRKKSIVFGNFILVLFMLTLIFSPNIYFILLANFLCAFGYAIKNIAETNLLYDSVATKGGDGLYAKIDSKGGSMYYTLDGITALVAGYLFVINNYLPMYVCLFFLILSTLISMKFKDVYDVRFKKSNNTVETFKEYGRDLKESCKFILVSKRMKALLLFRIVFYSLIKIVDIYRSDLLVNIGVPEEQFSMIFAILTFFAAMALYIRESIEKKFKNRTLTFISLTYIFSVIFIGGISRVYKGDIVIPIVLFFYVILKISTSIWYVLEGKYLKNFTNAKERSKITFTYELIGCLGPAIATVFAGKLLDIVSIQNAFLIVGLIGLAALILTLDFMRTRFGLKPREYSKKDIKFIS